MENMHISMRKVEVLSVNRVYLFCRRFCSYHAAVIQLRNKEHCRELRYITI